MTTPDAAEALREAQAAMRMADDATGGEFCGCWWALLSLEAQDEECGPAHTATQLIHAWLEKHPDAALSTPAAAPAPAPGDEMFKALFAASEFLKRTAGTWAAPHSSLCFCGEEGGE